PSDRRAEGPEERRDRAEGAQVGRAHQPDAGGCDQAPGRAGERTSRASVMMGKFAGVGRMVWSEFPDLNHARKTYVSSVPYDFEVRSRTRHRAPANFEIGTLA